VSEFKKSFHKFTGNEWEAVQGLQEAKKGGGGVRMSDEEKERLYGSFDFRGEK
jgi:hypothetical protein